MKRKGILLLVIVALLISGLLYMLFQRPRELVLTGIVTTDEVIVGPEIQGRLQQVLAREGDTVTNGQLLALIQPQEWKADLAYYSSSVEQSTAQVAQAEADLKFQEEQTSNQVSQAIATLAATEAQKKQAEADLENAALNLKRIEDLFHRGVEPEQSFDQARTAHAASRAHTDSVAQQVQAAQAALALARSNEAMVAARRAALEASIHQQQAMSAQRDKATVRLDHTHVRAPVTGIVDTRAALQGEVVVPGQPIVTLLDPDNLWVRADVEETYADHIRLGDKLKVRLPSGIQREGTVFFRGVDADYATQRDVSRSKRDIKTFEIRLRCDNQDRRLAVGMTAFVLLPLVTH
jgi:HlyD family secretion protein